MGLFFFYASHTDLKDFNDVGLADCTWHPPNFFESKTIYTTHTTSTTLRAWHAWRLFGLYELYRLSSLYMIFFGSSEIWSDGITLP